jgi:acyl carrier protein
MAARDSHMYLEILKKQNITILNQTPSAFYRLIDLELNHPGKELNIRTIIFGGEALYPAKLKEWKAKYPGTKLVNMYGITETTVHVTFKQIEDHEIIFNTCNIGSAIPTLYTYVMDNRLKLVPTGVAGELLVGGDGIGRGYLNQPELTGEKFVKNPYQPGERCYRSGDLVKRSAHGELEYMGRIDFQVKIRGFRIEVGEIENRLLKHEGIKETVVAAKESGKGDKYLCAYIVSRGHVDTPELRKYLMKSLPEYMVPTYFVPLDKIPLTSNGKVDGKALPEPGIKAGEGYIAPGGPVEEKLVVLWSEVLGIEKDVIGIDANFFELGGHSLKATILVTKIHKELNVKLPLAEIFTTPTIRGLSAHIRGLPGEKHVPVEPVEEKEYYPLSLAQSRLYIIQQMDLGSIGYNIPMVVELEGDVDMDRLEEAFGKLIERHESLRTSFLMIEEEPVQEIHGSVEFEIGRFDLSAGSREEKIINGFVRAFDLAKAPLLRVGILKTVDGRRIMMVDMHHIVTDGVSQDILVNDFLSLYSGGELPPLRLQYKDYSEWQRRMVGARFLKKQEEYWLNRFKGDIPVLNLPVDYPKRPDQTSYEGNTVRLPVDEELSAALYETLKGTEITVFMFLLAAYNVLLSKYTRQTDIIVVSPITGRSHTDFQNIIGMFVNMLALRNQPEENKTFREFLEDVKKSALDAFENQDYQFMELVRALGLQGNLGSSPLLNTVFTMQNLNNRERDSDTLKEIRHLKTRPYEYNRNISVFDLHLVASESNGILELTMVYSSYLFKRSTVLGISRHYIEILNQVLENPDIKLKEIKMSYELVAMKPKNINDRQDFEF